MASLHFNTEGDAITSGIKHLLLTVSIIDKSSKVLSVSEEDEVVAACKELTTCFIWTFLILGSHDSFYSTPLWYKPLQDVNYCIPFDSTILVQSLLKDCLSGNRNPEQAKCQGETPF